jgi:hypothetical protein
MLEPVIIPKNKKEHLNLNENKQHRINRKPNLILNPNTQSQITKPHKLNKKQYKLNMGFFLKILILFHFLEENTNS